MALSVFEYESQSSPVSLPGMNYVVKTCQAATPEEMQRLVDQALAEVVALNVAIAAAFPSDPNFLLTFADADLAGAGDGHTFTMMLTFVPLDVNVMASLFSVNPAPQSMAFAFAMAGDAEQLSGLIQGTAAEVGGDGEVLVVFQAVRGAAKGTRLMFGIGAIAGD